MKIIIVSNEQMLAQAFAIRYQVFVEEQKVPANAEIDEHENDSDHFLVFSDDKQAVATSRLRIVNGKAKIERVCVLASYRHLQVGKKLMLFMEQYASEKGLTFIFLHGQVAALPFYQKLGYDICSAPFIEEGIMHCVMTKQLAN